MQEFKQEFLAPEEGSFASDPRLLQPNLPIKQEYQNPNSVRSFSQDYRPSYEVLRPTPEPRVTFTFIPPDNQPQMQ